MTREETIARITQLAEQSTMKTMIMSMPWWNNWDSISDPGLTKVLESLEWHRAEIQQIVREAMEEDPSLLTVAYGAARKVDLHRLDQDEEEDSRESGWSTEELLRTL